MADQQGLTAPFPQPPPFYKHFTKANLSQLRQIRKEAGVPPTREPQDSDQKDIDILSLPPELRYLLPPPPPTADSYRSFGIPLDLNAPEATLQEAGIEQLYPDHPSVKLNPQPHLLALARSLLTTFLSLVGVLSQNPELYAEKVDDLQVICYNMHDLINRYRPHQARESLILMMEERVAGMREEMRRIEEGKVKMGRVVEQLREGQEALAVLGKEGSGTVGAGAEVKIETDVPVQVEDETFQRQRAAWKAIEQATDEVG